MAVSDLDVKAVYACNGATTTFAIPCAFIPVDVSNEIKVYKLLVSDGTLTLMTEAVGAANYTLATAYNAVSNPNGPANVILGTAPAATFNIVVIRSFPLTQTTAFTSTGSFNPKTIETGLDRLVMMIQDVAEKAGRALLLPFNAVFTSNTISKVTPLYVPRWNAAGDGWEMVSVASLLSSTPGGGLPSGGVLGDFVEKLTAADGDAAWLTGTFAGYSARYSASLNLVGLRTALLYIFNFQYTAPSASLSMVGSGTLREKGTSVASSLMTATVTKTSNNIAAARFYQGATLLSTTTANPPVPSGGAPTYNYATPFSDTISFTAQTDDILSGGNGPTTTTSNTVTFSFVYPYYWGSGASGLTAAQVAALTKTVQNNTNSQLVAFTPLVGQKYYFAYPASYGALTSILDQNGFETFSDWTLTTSNITGLDATAQSYRIYSFNNLVGVAGTYSYTFKK